MLINKTERSVQIRYNSKIIAVEPGQKLDVRDFDVANKDVRGCEKHIMLKNIGIFDLTEDKNDGVVSKEMQEELKATKDLLETEQKNLADLQKVNDQLTEKLSAMSGEVEEAKKSVLSMKKEVTKAKQEKKDAEEEVEGLRLQLSKGKK